MHLGSFEGSPIPIGPLLEFGDLLAEQFFGHEGEGVLRFMGVFLLEELHNVHEAMHVFHFDGLLEVPDVGLYCVTNLLDFLTLQQLYEEPEEHCICLQLQEIHDIHAFPVTELQQGDSLLFILG